MTSANTFSELEEMLKAFRCQDLANLLAFAGQTKNGKKSELYDRCINILKKGNPNIQFKLKDIYKYLLLIIYLFLILKFNFQFKFYLF